MKKIIFVLSLLLSLSAVAQNEKAAVTKAVEVLRLLMITPDKAKLSSMISDSLSYGHSSGRVQTKKELIDDLTSGRSDFVTIDLSNQTVSLNGDVALVRHILSAHTKDEGKPEADIQLGILTVWQKQKGTWKLLARQAVKVQ